MAVRTTSAAVIAILRNGSQGGDYDDVNSPSLTGYIETASMLVDRLEVIDDANDDILSASNLEIIERWLSAHFYMCSDRAQNYVMTGGAQANYYGESGKNLNFTPYGQQAVSLDLSGHLASIADGGGVSVGVNWLGKTDANKLDYSERNPGNY